MLVLAFATATSAFASPFAGCNYDAPINSGPTSGNVSVPASNDIVPFCDGWVALAYAASPNIVITHLPTGVVQQSIGLAAPAFRLRYDTDNDLLYATLVGDSRLARVDLASGSVTYWTLDAPGLDVALGNCGEVFVSTRPASGPAEVLVLDAGGSTLHAEPFTSAVWIAFDRGHNRLFAGVNGNSPSDLKAFNYDPAVHGLTLYAEQRDPGSNGEQLIVSADGDRVVFVCGGGNVPANGPYYNNVFSSADLTTVLNSWYIGAYPSAASYTPAGGLLFQTNGINLAAAKLQVGGGPPPPLQMFRTRLSAASNSARIAVSNGSHFVYLLDGQAGGSSPIFWSWYSIQDIAGPTTPWPCTTFTVTSTFTPSVTATPTATDCPDCSPTASPTVSPTLSATLTISPSWTSSPTWTTSPSVTATRSTTVTLTSTPSATLTRTPTYNLSSTRTLSASSTPSRTPSVTLTSTPMLVTGTVALCGFTGQGAAGGIYSLALAPGGGVIAVGDMDPGTGYVPRVQRFAESGAVQWSSAIVQQGTLRGVGIDASGQIVAGGAWNSGSDSGPLTLAYDLNGNQNWMRSLSGTTGSRADAMAVAPNGLAGSGGYLAQSQQVPAVWMYDAAGNLLWQRSWAGVGNAMGFNSIFDRCGRYWMAVGDYNGPGALLGWEQDGTQSAVLRLGFGQGRSVKQDPDGDLIYVADGGVVKLHTDGTILWAVNPGFQPWDVATDREGSVYVGGDDGWNFTVKKFSRDGLLSWIWTSPSGRVESVVVEDDGTVWAGGWGPIAQTGTPQLFKLCQGPIGAARPVLGCLSPTPTRTLTVSATSTRSPTPSPTWSSTRTASRTRTSTATVTPTPSATTTATPTGTGTVSPTATSTDSPTLTVSETPTCTVTGTGTLSPTGSATPSLTATDTDSPTLTVSETPTYTVTDTDSPTATSSTTPTVTATPTDSPTLTASATPTFTVTNTVSPTATSSMTPTVTATPTDSPTLTGSTTVTYTVTSTMSPSATSSATPTATATATSSTTPTVTATGSASPTASSTFSPTLTVSSTSSSTATRTGTSTATATASATRTSSATPSVSRSPTATFAPTRSSTFTLTRTFTVSPTRTPTCTVTRTATITPTPSRSSTRTASATVTRTATRTPTPMGAMAAAREHPGGVKTLAVPGAWAGGAHDLFVAPNPVRDVAELHFRAPACRSIELRVSALSGESLLKVDQLGFAGGSSKQVLDLRDLASGVYLVTMTVDLGQGTILVSNCKLALVR